MTIYNFDPEPEVKSEKGPITIECEIDDTFTLRAWLIVGDLRVPCKLRVAADSRDTLES